MKHIVIGTTAINRPFLHNDNILDWYNWINNTDRKKFKLHWFINIDMIEKLNSSFEETKNNFKNIIKNIPITFLKNPEGKGNFLNACQRISKNIENHVVDNNLDKDNVIVFWLEDDWKLNTKIAFPIEYIIDNYMSNICHVNLSYIRNNYIHALAPGLFNYKLWEKLHLQAWKEQKEHIDPEHCVGKFFLKRFNTKFINIHNLTVINQFKKHGGGFLNSSFLNYQNSYYTYDKIEKKTFIKKTILKKKILKISSKII